MRAIDTNIIVRLIARDHAEQVEIAERIIAEGEVVILPTVLLECEWVLRSRYKMPRALMAEGFATLFGQPGVTVLSADAVAGALSRYARAGDFGDLLHLALAEAASADTFATFDRDLSIPSGSMIALETL